MLYQLYVSSSCVQISASHMRTGLVAEFISSFQRGFLLTLTTCLCMQTNQNNQTYDLTLRQKQTGPALGLTSRMKKKKAVWSQTWFKSDRIRFEAETGHSVTETWFKCGFYRLVWSEFCDLLRCAGQTCRQPIRAVKHETCDSTVSQTAQMRWFPH